MKRQAFFMVLLILAITNFSFAIGTLDFSGHGSSILRR